MPSLSARALAGAYDPDPDHAEYPLALKLPENEVPLLLNYYFTPQCPKVVLCEAWAETRFASYRSSGPACVNAS